ncbi:hypothetical protein BAMA_04385 [Bacillus manliponensis]|uniref:Uncharacterized protein n=1 Tax=Bacillus manliponensis TaxID=574376 RepID=A0A073K8E2_9BACI|nr:hypothetical protein [Bacillus manliponensis]KEK18513.1 hypothetical protein BAMA_04385 [Bacillus manliponensis]
MWQELLLKKLILKIIEADRESFKVVAALSDLDIHVENKTFFSLFNILRDMIGEDCFIEVLESYEKGEVTLEEMGDIFYQRIESKHTNLSSSINEN